VRNKACADGSKAPITPIPRAKIDQLVEHKGEHRLPSQAFNAPVSARAESGDV